MKILGMNITKISGERKNIIKGKIDVKQNIDIKDIEKQDIAISDKPGLKVEFEYSIKYEPKVADVEIKGSILVLDDKNESKDILKDWKKKKINPIFKIPVYNYIIEKVSLKAINMEDELALPLHQPFPKIAPKPVDKENPNYTG